MAAGGPWIDVVSLDDVGDRRPELFLQLVFALPLFIAQAGEAGLDIKSEWKRSETNRRAKYYSLTRAGRKAFAEEAANWERCRRRFPGSCAQSRTGGTRPHRSTGRGSCSSAALGPRGEGRKRATSTIIAAYGLAIITSVASTTAMTLSHLLPRRTAPIGEQMVLERSPRGKVRERQQLATSADMGRCSGAAAIKGLPTDGSASMR